MTEFEPRPQRQCDSEAGNDPLLVVDGLTVEIAARRTSVTAVDGVSFALRRGETLGLVGESGSGKSLTCSAIMRLMPHRSVRITGGSIRLEGTDLLTLPEREMHEFRGGQIAMILQDPMTSLNPLFTIGDQLVEAISTHNDTSRRAARSHARELLERVQLTSSGRGSEARLRQYPHQLSGGQRQRVVGALALAGTPSVIIADEPTTSLDVTVQAQYLRLLKRVQRETGAAILFVTHDFGVVAAMCDRVAVMYAGRIVETGASRQILAEPKHPYTKGLLESVAGRMVGGRLPSIPGQPPMPGSVISGCHFAPRCPKVMARCTDEDPPAVTHDVDGAPPSLVRCWLQVTDG